MHTFYHISLFPRIWTLKYVIFDNFVISAFYSWKFYINFIALVPSLNWMH